MKEGQSIHGPQGKARRDSEPQLGPITGWIHRHQGLTATAFLATLVGVYALHPDTPDSIQKTSDAIGGLMRGDDDVPARASALSDAGREAEAVALLKNAKKRDEEVCLLEFQILKKTGNKEGALASLQEAAGRSKTPRVYGTLASFLEQMGRDSEAVAAYEDALNASGDSPPETADKSIMIGRVISILQKTMTPQQVRGWLTERNLGDFLTRYPELGASVASRE